MDEFVWFLACMESESILVYLDLIQPGRKLRRHLSSGFDELDLWATSIYKVFQDTLPYIVYTRYIRIPCPIYLRYSRIHYPIYKVSQDTLSFTQDILGYPILYTRYSRIPCPIQYIQGILGYPTQFTRYSRIPCPIYNVFQNTLPYIVYTMYSRIPYSIYKVF